MFLYLGDFVMDLLTFIQFIMGCEYISDLRTEPYNVKAKLLLKQLNLNNYSLKQVEDAFKYIYMC